MNPAAMALSLRLQTAGRSCWIVCKMEPLPTRTAPPGVSESRSSSTIWVSRTSVDGAVPAGDWPWPGQSTPMLRNPSGSRTTCSEMSFAALRYLVKRAGEMSVSASSRPDQR